MSRVAEPAKSLFSANLAPLGCVLLGGSMLGWGTAALLMEQIFDPSGPTPADLLAYTVLFLLGSTYLGLGILTRRRVCWALWTAYVLSTVLFLTTVAFALVLQTHYGNTYLILLSFATACASGLTLRTRYPEASAAPPEPLVAENSRTSARGLIGASASSRASAGRWTGGTPVPPLPPS
jgi:hypothetical protein